MYKKKMRPIGFLIVIVALVIFFYPRMIGTKPFAKLKAEDVASATVRLIPPDTTAPVYDVRELVAALNEVVIYNRDDAYQEYSGQAVIYTLTMKNGDTTTINAYAPFLVIDGVGYKAKLEPCEKLSQIANRMI